VNLHTPLGTTHFPPFKIKVVDTTGAGDAFISGFLASIIRGESIEESIM
jgi:sugar/nucleoside kinase (ribokinase family)